MPEMTAGALVDLLQLFESSGIDVWLDGGCAVDAVHSAQTRPHKDVDIIVRVADFQNCRRYWESGALRFNLAARNQTSCFRTILGSRSMFTRSSLTAMETACTGWKMDRTESSRLRDSAGRVSSTAHASAACHQKLRCSATLTGIFRQTRTCETWNYSKPASALSFRRISGANKV